MTSANRWVIRIAALLIGFPIGLRAATEAEISRIQDTKATIQAFYDQLQQNTRRLIRRNDGPPEPRAGSVMRVPVAGPPGTILLTGLPTAVGRLKGEFSVSNSGTATYTIPLDLPRGAGGLQPQLSLAYSSAAGNGLLGVGWSLAGFGSIEHCEATYAQNAGSAPPLLASYDRYCYEGQQLKIVGANLYRTEIDGFAYIQASGTAGTAPASWTVKTKGGLTYEFGGTIDSRIEAIGYSTPREWAVSRITDRAGNYIQFSYSEDTTNGTYRPSVITYASNAAGPTAPYRVLFGYESRPDVPTLYIYGNAVKEPNRLGSVVVQYWDGASYQTKNTYGLGYTTSTDTGRSELTDVQQCSATECYLPTSIYYTHGTTGVGWQFESSTSATIPLMAYSMNVDVDGDGADDLLYPTATNWAVLLSTGTQLSNSPITTTTPATNYPQAMPIDFNSDGRMDILVPNSSGNWRVLISQGTLYFNTIDTTSPATGAGGNAWVADYNGDGRPDVCYVSGLNIQCIRNNGSNFDPPVTRYTLSGATFATTAAPSLNEEFSSEIRTANFDNDGITDLLVLVNSGGTNVWRALVSLGGSYTNAGDISTSTLATGGLADINGDRQTDLVYVCGSVWCIRYGNGFGIGPQVVTSTSAGSGNDVLLVDWDGDGLTDILRGAVGGNYSFYRSTGTTISTGASTSIPVVPATSSPRIQDIDADGRGDLVYNDGTNLIKNRLHYRATTDLAYSFTDAYQMNTTVLYRGTREGSVWSRNNSTVFPNQEFVGNLIVVQQVMASDGAGGTFTQSYYYYGGLVNVQGRGFLGFRARQIYDSRSNNTSALDVYSQVFPYTGMPIEHYEYQPNGITLTRKTITTNNYLTGGSGLETRYFPYPSQKVESVYEYGGSKNGLLITETTSTLTYDGYGNATDVTTTVVDKDAMSPWVNEAHTTRTVNTITNDTTNWCLGRPTQTVVTNTSPGFLAQSRTTSATIDYIKCRPTQEIVEPASTTLKVVRDFSYDTFGNLSSTSTTGRNPDGTSMTTRTTHTNFGTRGIYPETITDALGFSTTIAYDYLRAVPLSSTDPNGLTSSWQYDSFGRKSLETRPDNTKTSWSYLVCNSANSYCGVSDLRWEVVETEMTVSSLPIRTNYLYFDGADRKRYDQRQNLAGGLTSTVTSYDSLGRILRQFVPVSTGGSHYQQYTYDILNRATAVALYNSAGVFNRQSVTTYSGRATTTTDAKGFAKVLYSDVRGKLRRVVDPAPGGTTNHSYDPFGNLTTVTDAIGATSTTSYDVRGFRTGFSDADRGTWVLANNSLGELVSQTNANSQVTTYLYDLLGRRISRLEPEGTATWTYGVSAAARNIGKIAAVGDAAYSETLTYDGVGRLAQRFVAADTMYVVDYSYDAATGLLDNMTYPASTGSTRLRAQYLYQYGKLRSVRDYDAPATVWWQLNAEDARGNATDETLGNGVHILSNMDELTGHLNSRASGTNGAAYNNQQNLTFAWDLNENLTDRVDVAQGLTEHVNYDALDRITDSTLNGANNLTVGLDASGNITSKTNIGTYTYDLVKKHAVVSTSNGWSFSYDAAGNMLAGRGATITWASYSLPSSIVNGSQSSQFYYTPDRQYWKQVAQYSNGPETTIYVAGVLEKVTGTGVTDYRHMISVGNATIVVTRSTGSNNNTYYATRDHLGSSSVITNSSGVIVVSESFDAFGKRRGSNWSGSPNSTDLSAFAQTTRRGFTGHTTLDNLGLIHMNGRVYDPELGRFMSADPWIQSIAETQSINPFSYCWNNPLKYTDPSGFGIFSFIGRALSGIGHALSRLWHNSLFRSVFGIAVAAFTGYVWTPIGGTAGSFANLTFGGALGGFASTGNLRGALNGALTAALFYGAGSFGEGRGIFAQTTAHGLVGCVSAVASGADCRRGVLSASVAHYGGARTPTFDTAIGNTVKSGIIGGATSALSGGRFEDGFTTGSFGYLFNAVAHEWAEIGKLVHTLIPAAMIADNPSLAFRLQIGVRFTLTGRQFLSPDLILDGKYIYEIKPFSWSHDINTSKYAQALRQIAGYQNMGRGFVPGTWEQLGQSAQWNAVGVWAQGPNFRFESQLTFGYDGFNNHSGLLFYSVSGFPSPADSKTPVKAGFGVPPWGGR